jgi:hypothetical protein
MNSSPFEAPTADHDPHAFAWLVVPAAWGLAGGACGTALGLTLQLTQAISGAAASGGLLAAAGGAFLGAVALMVERRSSLSRPELVDGRGTRSRPLHGAVLFLPVLVAFPSLLWLVFAGSIGVDSLLPAVAFGMIAVVVAVAGVRVLGRHQLARAIEALELGPHHGGYEPAIRTLSGLGRSWWLGRSVWSTARLNLAMLALNSGDGGQALSWADGVHRGAAGAWAGTTRALALLLQGGSPDEAEKSLTQALTGPGARAVQPEADAVRVLLVWRRDGEKTAHEVAQHLFGPQATALHRALLARLHERVGEAEEARMLRGPEVKQLLSSGLGQAIRELR